VESGGLDGKRDVGGDVVEDVFDEFGPLGAVVCVAFDGDGEVEDAEGFLIGEEGDHDVHEVMFDGPEDGVVRDGLLGEGLVGATGTDSAAEERPGSDALGLGNEGLVGSLEDEEGEFGGIDEVADDAEDVGGDTFEAHVVGGESGDLAQGGEEFDLALKGLVLGIEETVASAEDIEVGSKFTVAPGAMDQHDDHSQCVEGNDRGGDDDDAHGGAIEGGVLGDETTEGEEEPEEDRGGDGEDDVTQMHDAARSGFFTHGRPPGRGPRRRGFAGGGPWRRREGFRGRR